MSIYSGPNTTQSGLVLHLDATNVRSYPRSGNNWFDISGFSNNGSNGGPVFSSDFGGIIRLDGIDDLVDFSNNSTLYNAWETSFTQEYIIKVISNASTTKTIFRVDDWARIDINISTSKIVFTIGYSSPIDTLTYNTTINYNQWYHLAFVWTKLSQQKIYVNGVNVAQRVPTISSYTGNTSTGGGANIGRGHQPPYQSNINADFAVFKHYNRVLSDQEIINNFNATRGRYGI